MPTIFCNPGRLVALSPDAECALPIQIALECWGGGQLFRALITQVNVTQQGGYQFIHTLRDRIFMYVFGERIGELVISGLTTTGGCDADDSNPGLAGIESVMAYYQAMRATRRNAPVNISIGRVAFKAFLLSMRTDIADAETGLGHFVFRFHFPPRSATIGGIVVNCPDPNGIGGNSGGGGSSGGGGGGTCPPFTICLPPPTQGSTSLLTQ